jgi:hypothetical protein
MGSELAEIVDALHHLDEQPERVLGRDQVLQWAATDDLEALGALSAILFEPRYAKRIEPSLTLPEYMAIELPYLARCLKEDPPGPWSESRWSAGGLLAGWIKDVWADERFRPAVDEFQEWLASIYKSSPDADLRPCLVQATLEHLFEIEEIADRFSAWRDDPVLMQAYEDAKLWKEGLDELGMKPVDLRAKP